MKTPTRIPGGDWLAVCDRTGFRMLASNMSRQWNNLMVYNGVWEIRQPQDFVRGVKDDMTVPWARPVTEPVFVAENPLGTTWDSYFTWDSGVLWS
jgi:hypothetical protein